MGTQRVTGLGDALRRFRRTVLDVSQQDLAARLGLTRSAYASYELEVAALPHNVLQALRAMGFRGEAGAISAVTPQFNMPIAYLGRIAASSPANWSDPFDTEATKLVPSEMAQPQDRRFCCRVESDSCFGLLWPDDLAVFHADGTPRIGRIVFYVHRNQLCTIKQLRHDGHGYLLHPLNPSYEDVPADGIIWGYLVGIVREVGGERITRYNKHGILPNQASLL